MAGNVSLVRRWMAPLRDGLHVPFCANPTALNRWRYNRRRTTRGLAAGSRWFLCERDTVPSIIINGTYTFTHNAGLPRTPRTWSRHRRTESDGLQPSRPGFGINALRLSLIQRHAQFQGQDLGRADRRDRTQADWKSNGEQRLRRQIYGFALANCSAANITVVGRDQFGFQHHHYQRLFTQGFIRSDCVCERVCRSRQGLSPVYLQPLRAEQPRRRALSRVRNISVATRMMDRGGANNSLGRRVGDAMGRATADSDTS